MVKESMDPFGAIARLSPEICVDLDFCVRHCGCTASTAMIPYGPSGTGSDPRVN